MKVGDHGVVAKYLPGRAQAKTQTHAAADASTTSTVRRTQANADPAN
jgi:hypothetical protein